MGGKGRQTERDGRGRDVKRWEVSFLLDVKCREVRQKSMKIQDIDRLTDRHTYLYEDRKMIRWMDKWIDR